jgi:hypothetical protein
MAMPAAFTSFRNHGVIVGGTGQNPSATSIHARVERLVTRAGVPPTGVATQDLALKCMGPVQFTFVKRSALNQATESSVADGGQSSG